MQTIEYEDGKKTKKKFKTILAAITNAEEKAKQKQIKSLKITRIIPNKKRRKNEGSKSLLYNG